MGYVDWTRVLLGVAWGLAIACVIVMCMPL